MFHSYSKSISIKNTALPFEKFFHLSCYPVTKHDVTTPYNLLSFSSLLSVNWSLTGG